jgi:hypothetical protein
LFRIGPGPDSGGPKPRPGCAHTPESSGKGVELYPTLPAGPLVGALVCPCADVAAPLANITVTRKSRRKFMARLPFLVSRVMPEGESTPFSCVPE